jgi:hypothetical protein
MPKVATAFHPLLRPLFKPRQRAMREEVARARLNKVGTLFIQAREGRTDNGFRLWVRGYGLTKKDHEAGLTGHYVIFQLVEESDGWRIVTNKDIQPIDKHPERARPKGVGMPNWGHPVLRSAKKNRVFWSDIEAKLHVQILVDEFPKAAKTKQSITKVRVYSKHPELGSIVENILLRLEAQADGTWMLSYIPDPASRTSKLRTEGEEAIQGDFTKNVLTRPKKRQQKPVSAGKEIVERLREEKRAEAAAEQPEVEVPKDGAVARLMAARAAKAARGGPRPAPQPAPTKPEGD